MKNFSPKYGILLFVCFLIFGAITFTSGQISSTDLLITNVYSDSLVDVFPLSVGNKWLYDYEYHYSFYKPPNWTDDSGTVEIEIVGKIDLNDPVIWQIREHRIFQRHFRSPYEGGGIDTTYTIDTIFSINLYEVQSGQHLLSTDCNSSVFYFGCFDTIKVYRYQIVDSDQNITLKRDQGSAWYHHLTFHRDQGLLSDSFYRHPADTEERIVTLLGSTIVPVNPPEPSWPLEMHLLQNYPNPFNPVTTIEYWIPTTEHVKFRIFNILGEEISTLVDEMRSPGIYKVDWNADKFPSGVYFYRLQAGSFLLTKKLLLIR